MGKYRITFDKKTCIGSGACASVCPENWELVEKNGVFKARPKKLDISEEELMSNQEAVDICPVDAIKIEKIKGRQSSIADDEEDGEDDDEELLGDA